MRLLALNVNGQNLRICIAEPFELKSDGALPEAVKIAVTGEWKGHTQGCFSISEDDLVQMKDNFEKSTLDLVFDLEHASVWYEKAPAYGWGKSMDIRAGSLFASQLEWLPEAVELVSSRKYRYLSPVLVSDTIDPVSGEPIGWSVHSVALTNTPFLEELGEILANKLPAHTGENPQTNHKETYVNEQEYKDHLAAKEAEIKALGEKVTAFEAKEAAAHVAACENAVEEAIACGKLGAGQKESALALAKTDKTSFDAFMQGLPEPKSGLGTALYAASKGGGADASAIASAMKKYT